jgi:hypothetical protein
MVKQTIRRVFPDFDEEYHGYGSFADLLEGAREQGLIDLEFDEKRGNYVLRTRR